ncbi:MAG: hypothetical protein LBS98_03985 [Coriobacteriales bacterium]|jgi:hypothetical protein|nr:hypothetical protein [Coriobacteriales bacterium]
MHDEKTNPEDKQELEDKADRRGVIIGLALVVVFFIALILLFACSHSVDSVYTDDTKTLPSSGKPTEAGAERDVKAPDKATDADKDDGDGRGADSAGGEDTPAFGDESSSGGSGSGGTGSGSGSAGSGSPGSGSTGSSGSGSTGGSGGGGTAPGGSGSGGTGGSGGGGATTPTDPNAGKTWHPAWDESVWVVDVPGHNNEVYHQEEGHYAAVCNTCGAELGPGLAGQHLLGTGHDSYRSNIWFTDVPAWIESVWVPEVGHWTTIHHPGYWQ